MKTNILNSSVKKYLIYIIVLLCLVYISLLIRNELGYMGDGYRLISGRADDIRISKDNRIIIQPTITDLNNSDKYLIGIRLKAEHLKCDNNQRYIIRVINKVSYFVIYKKTGKTLEFNSIESFQKHLQSLSIADNLNYKSSDEIWNIYSKYEFADYSRCRELKQLKGSD